MQGDDLLGCPSQLLWRQKDALVNNQIRLSHTSFIHSSVFMYRDNLNTAMMATKTAKHAPKLAAKCSSIYTAKVIQFIDILYVWIAGTICCVSDEVVCLKSKLSVQLMNI